MFNLKIIVYTLGLLLVFNGAFMLFPTFLSWYLEEAVSVDLILALLIIFLAGFSMMFFTRDHNRMVI